MVNFCVNLTGPWGAQIKHNFWVCLWGCLIILAFESMGWMKKTALPYVGGHHPIHWRPGYDKKAEEGRIPLPAWLPLDWTGIYITDFSGSWVCRWQIMGPLSLYNHISQFIKYISYGFFSSGDHDLTQILELRIILKEKYLRISFMNWF